MLLKLSKIKIRKKSGFSLIELSMVLAISGMLFSSGLIAYQSLLYSSQTKTAQENIDTIYKAIGNYLITNRKLPCPASLILPESDPTYGLSIGSDGACSGSGVIISSVATNLAYGMVPVKTLGLSNQVAKDGFNTKLSYIVDLRFTAVTNISSVASANGFEGSDPNAANMIEVRELTNASTPAIITNGVMVILSHGLNKLGGFNASSSNQNSNPTSADELTNVRTANFDKIFVASSTDQLFDDTMIFKNKIQLAMDSGFENMMCLEGDSSYLVDLGTNSGTNKCYDDNTISISLTWTNANYGEINIPKSNTPCPAGCVKNLNPTDYDSNSSTYHPLRRCNKYGIWSKVIYPCYKTTTP